MEYKSYKIHKAFGHYAVGQTIVTPDTHLLDMPITLLRMYKWISEIENRWQKFIDAINEGKEVYWLSLVQKRLVRIAEGVLEHRSGDNSYTDRLFIATTAGYGSGIRAKLSQEQLDRFGAKFDKHFEYTGEFRPPNQDEWFHSVLEGDNQVMCAGCDDAYANAFWEQSDEWLIENIEKHGRWILKATPIVKSAVWAQAAEAWIAEHYAKCGMYVSMHVPTYASVAELKQLAAHVAAAVMNEHGIEPKP